MNHETNLAYAAGIIDGEGYLGISNAPKYQPSIRVQMTAVTPLTWLKQTFGGSIVTTKAIRAENEGQFLWSINDRQTLKPFLSEVLPYLKVKRLSCLLIIEYCSIFNEKRVHGHIQEESELKEKYYEVCKAANSRGPGSNALKDTLLKAVS